MFLRLATIVAWFAAAPLAIAATAADPLTLEDAFVRVSERHPQLRLVEARAAGLLAERDIATLATPWTVGVQAENVAGTGQLRGIGGGEITLTLASVLERGDKRDARGLLAQSRIDALALERESRRLDLLADVARRYLAGSAALHARELAVLDVEQRQRAVTAARERFRAGASPEAMALNAEAALARAQLARARANAQWLAARQHLAALWADKSPTFELGRSEPLQLPIIPDVTALADLLARNPELARFADERRIAEARVQLAAASASADLNWQVGIRALNTSNDVALVAALQFPIGARRRAEPGTRAARAELTALEIEREGAEVALYATLIEAHGLYRVAQLEVATLRDEVLPALIRAEAATERAWRAGASSYLEWSQLQAELTDTRRQQLDAAIDAQRALIEIQRLTGDAFIAGPTITEPAP